ncbi:MAG: ECF transporter S component [Clostridia bacterium]|nr:ECF transporter S component [Clostridia bacterium]
MKKFNTLNVVTTAMLCAFAVVISSAMHNLAGSVTKSLSPMHLPVFMAGILCGNWLGLICGACAPVLGFLTSGRPAFPNSMIPMMFELATYGFVSGLMRNIFVKNPKTHKFASVLALVVAMVAGRVVNGFAGGIVLAIGGAPLGASILAKLASGFTSTWIGIIVQLILVPAILFAMQKSGVLIKYLPEERPIDTNAE